MPKLRYVGTDRTTDWLPGVPARDLTAAEAAKYPQAEASAFYVIDRREPKSTKTEPAGRPDEQE